MILVYAFGSYKIESITNEKAKIEARTLFEINLVYRRFFAHHGGLYAPITENFKPNPYLNVPKRDIVSNYGDNLTLINPAWMSRMVFEMLQKQSKDTPIMRIVSNHYINPVNKPDEWEQNALLSFEAGTKEVNEISKIDGKTYMRLIKPLYVEKGCLRCHADQGYKIGDMRGGITVAVPMQTYIDLFYSQRNILILISFFMWFIGITTISYLCTAIRIKNAEVIEVQKTKHNAMRDMLLAIMHNWRQPINIIALITQNIEDNYNGQTLTQKFMQNSVSSIMNVLESMSANITLYTSLIKSDSDPQPLHLSDLITTVLSSFYDTFIQNNITCTFLCHIHGYKTDDIRHPLPCSKYTVINTYESELHRVITAIITNSIEAISKHKEYRRFSR